jgi:transposase-like protein
MGRFSTELFERYQRSERALVAALAEMYVQGVSTRKVKAITEELCGHSFSASSISAMNQRLDASLAQFADRPLAEAFPYLILDARYERVREAGVIASQAVLIAIGIDWDGRRQVLAVELAHRESRSSWRDFLLGLKARGLHGVEFVVADDHAGLRAALREVLAEAAYQRCYVHFLRNRSTTCRAGSMTTACRSCAGCMTAAILPRRAAIWRPGLPSGRANIPSSPAGSKKISMRR